VQKKVTHCSAKGKIRAGLLYEEALAEMKICPLLHKDGGFLGPSPSGTQKPTSLVLAYVNTRLAFMRQEVMFGNTPPASEVHPQIKYILIGLKRRRFPLLQPKV